MDVSLPPCLTTASDQDLVALARLGREDGYRELLRRWHRPVYALVYRIVRDRETAKDLTQETFVRMFHALESFRPNKKFSSWILKIAQNAALNYLKRRSLDTVALEGSPNAVTPEAMRATAIQVADRSPTTSTTSQSIPPSVDPEAIRQAVEQAIGRLRKMYRLCIILRDVQQRSYDDIAETLHLPVGTVKTYLHRARKELREELKHLTGTVRDYLRYLRRHRSSGTPTPTRIAITPS